MRYRKCAAMSLSGLLSSMRGHTPDTTDRIVVRDLGAEQGRDTSRTWSD